MYLTIHISPEMTALIKERLPIRIGSDGRVLPTGAAAVPLLGPPPRGPSLMRRRPNPRDRGSLPFEQNGPKEDIDDLRVVVRICPL